MSFKNIKFLNKGVKNRNIESSNRIIESYTSLTERKNNPVISLPIKNERKINISLLTPLKPHLTSIKNIKNEKKVKLINRINSFRKIYFNNNLNQDSSTKEIKRLKKENDFFSKYYKKLKLKKGENKNEYFSDIKQEYEKRKYYVPPLNYKKNIFKDNLLLCNDQKLQDFILYDKGSKKSNEKSLLFLEKIKNTINSKKNINQLKPLMEINRNPLIGNNYDTDIIINGKKGEIKKSKSEIQKVKNIINIIDEIDFFFNSTHKQYLNYLKFGDSREKSAKISTRINSANDLFENIHFINNDNNNRHLNYKLNLNSLNTENTNETNLTNNIIEKGISPSKTDKKFSSFCGVKNYEEILERFNNSKIIRDIKKAISFKINTKIDNLNKLKTKKIKTKKLNKEYFKTTLERLYEKISKNENVNDANLNEQIKKYIFKYKNNFSFEEEKEITPYNLSKKIENARKKIFNFKNIQDSIYLRKKSGKSLDKINKIRKRNLQLKENIIQIEEKMISDFNDLNIEYMI